MRWAGQFKEKGKKPSIVFKAVADRDIWIWVYHFGKPGSLNYIIILDTSLIITSISKGNLLPDFDYTFNGNFPKNLYFLVDGIYPPYSIIVSTLSEATIRKERAFSSAQEAMKKDVERAFEVLFSRWALLAKPCTVMDRGLAARVIKAAIIFHNMVVEARSNGCKSKLWSLAEKAVERGLFIDENGEKKQFQ